MQNLSIELPKCNLILLGLGTDVNGNATTKLCFPNKRAFSIQSHEYAEGKTVNVHNVHEFYPQIIAYVAKFGSKLQKSLLKTYKS